MTDKTYTVVGTSIRAGVKKLRLANGTAAARAKILEKDNHTEVRLFDLPTAMTQADAEQWLIAQGDAVPVKVAPAAKPGRPKNKNTTAVAAVTELTVIQHEELGLKASGMSREYWNEQSLLSRQEYSRNAAVAAGIECPPGTYPELEEWLELSGVFTRQDGTVYEAAV